MTLCFRTSRLLAAVLMCVAATPLLAQVTGPAADPADDRPPVACDLPDQYIPRSTWNANLWPGGVVPYAVDAAVTATNATRLRAAMDELQTTARVQFVPRTSEANYLYVQNGGGNNSYVGRVGGSQTVNLVNWSSRYIVCHELMHALGMWHEQQRTDRDTYVTINLANCQPGYEGNFTVRNGTTVVGPFDFESVMLYDDCSFSTCCAAGSTCNCVLSCATIQAQPAYSQYQNSMGNRSYLSYWDKAGIAARYGARCGSADFNGDGDIGTDQDIEAFFRCLSGNCCAACFAGGADFNGDGDIGTDQDIEAFFRVLAGGTC